MEYRGPYPKPPQLPEEDQTYRLAHFLSDSEKEEVKKRDEAILAITKLIA